MTRDHVLLNSSQTRASETSPVKTLMEAAGKAVYEHIISRYSVVPVQVVCGPGNNGGDGYVVARLLKENGWPVTVVGALQTNPPYSRALWQGDVLPFSPDSINAGALIVDAIFGIGLQRDLDDIYGPVVLKINETAKHIVSVDIPSGVNADTGHVMGVAIKANETITFDFRKPGHVLLPGRENRGELIIKDIGLDVPDDVKVYVNHPDLWRHLYPVPDAFSNKYNRGHLSILGGPEMTGAARLAAESARRMGAGLTRIESLPLSHEIYQAQCPGVLVDAIHHPEEFGKDDRITAALLGPGSGRSHFTKDAVLSWLATEKPCVLDADALYVFKDCPDVLFDALYPAVVLTPHEGEFRNLFEMSDNKIESVQAAAKRSGATVLLKGSDTVISTPSGLTIVQDLDCAYLSTGGTGDVLAGMIASLLAQNMTALAASACAAYIHGLAGQKIGLGLIAEDISEKIPVILKEIILRD